MTLIPLSLIALFERYSFVYLFKYKNWEECSNKAVMGKTLNKATLSEIEVEICSIEKQRQIVNILAVQPYLDLV